MAFISVVEWQRILSWAGFVFVLVPLIVHNSLPWVRITEHDEKHYWHFVNTTNISAIKAVHTNEYHVDVFMGLFNAKGCIEFQSGQIPNLEEPNNPTMTKGHEICSVVSYSQVDAMVLDHHVWEEHSKPCKNASGATVAFVIMALTIFVLIIICERIEFCKKSLCMRNKSKANNILLSVISFSVSIFVFIALIIFSSGCKSGGSQLFESFYRSNSGASGLFVTMVGGLLFFSWSIIYSLVLFGKLEEGKPVVMMGTSQKSHDETNEQI